MAEPNPAATASMPRDRWLVPFTRFCMNRSYARFSNRRIRTICRYRASDVARSTVPVGRSSSAGSIPGGEPPSWCSSETVDIGYPCRSWSEAVGDEQLLRREGGEYRGACRGDHHL